MNDEIFKQSNRKHAACQRIKIVCELLIMVITIPLAITAIILMVIGFVQQSFPMLVLGMSLSGLSMIPTIVMYLTHIIGEKIAKPLKLINKSFEYMEGGILYQWHDKTFEYNDDKKWLDTALMDIDNSGAIDFSNINIVSPSCGIGRYEKKIAEKYPSVHVYATDLYIPKRHEESKGNFTYIDKDDNSGLHMRDYLRETNVTSVNVIWDIKGCIWYASKAKQNNDLI